MSYMYTYMIFLKLKFFLSFDFKSEIVNFSIVDVKGPSVTE